MSDILFYDMLEIYCKKIIEIPIWELLEINRTVWSQYKKRDKLPMHHYKKISELVGEDITFDHKKLCISILELYYIKR